MNDTFPFVDPVKGNNYIFPHNNEVIEEGASHFFSLPKMCVTECQFGFKVILDNGNRNTLKGTT